MSKKEKALKLAMDYLLSKQIGAHIIAALREALAEQPAPPPECQTEAEKTAFAFGWWKALEHVRQQPAQQEPVGWWDDELGFFAEKHFDQLQPIYKSPPQRTWVGLTDEEIPTLTTGLGPITLMPFRETKAFVRAISAKLREKNNG